MSQRERDRLRVLSQVAAGALSLVKGAEVLGLSYRQSSRLLSRYRAEGDFGLIHRGRGRVSNRRLSDDLRQQCLDLIKDNYSDYGPTLACETLFEFHGLSVSRETLRGWLISSGFWSAKRRKVVHRQWRERRVHFGELVQMDTSEHDWLEGRGQKMYLISMIDDATSRLTARFYSSDSTINNMDLLRRYIKRHGRPVSLYTDKASHFVYSGPESLADQLSGRRPQTQLGRALEELNIELILANSPQAKGRVERLFKTLQDRLVKRLRLVGANDPASANKCLEGYFIPFWNARFSVAPVGEADLHRNAADFSLEQIFSIRDTRVVSNDYTFNFKTNRYQIERRSVKPGLRGGQIVVETRLDGRVKARFRGEYLMMKKLPEMNFRKGRSSGGSAAVAASSPAFASLSPVHTPQRRTSRTNSKASFAP